jgi:hypothetical protein
VTKPEFMRLPSVLASHALSISLQIIFALSEKASNASFMTWSPGLSWFFKKGF